MRKIFLIRTAVTPVELLLPVRTGTGGRRSRWPSGPFIVLLTNQQAFTSLRFFTPLRETTIFKPLKLLYG